MRCPKFSIRVILIISGPFIYCSQNKEIQENPFIKNYKRNPGELLFKPETNPTGCIKGSRGANFIFYIVPLDSKC